MFKLSLNNYRGFINEEIEFSKINILIGENSAGKSSLIKFLLTLRQSLTKPNDKELNLTFTGDQVDLGNYKEIIFNHDESKKLFFQFEFKEDYYDFFEKEFKHVGQTSKQLHDKKTKKDVVLSENLENIIKNFQNSKTSASYELTNQLDQHSAIVTNFYNSKIGKIEIIHNKESEEIIEEDTYLFEPLECILKFEDFDSKMIYSFNVEFEKRAFMSIIAGTSLKSQIKDLNLSKDDQDLLFAKIAFLVIVQNYIQFNLSQLRFINPIKSKPERFYFEKDRKKSNIVNDIEGLVNFISGLSKKGYQKIIEDFISILSDYGITEAIDVKKDENSFRELRVKVKNLWSNITDVGYGVSLQLPILFQAMISENTTSGRFNDIFRKGQILLIEQPEVHLHPNLQAKFIETLTKIGSNNIYFIETHSEYIIRKLQILIKNQSYGIKKTDVSINYLRRDFDKFVKTVHEIDENGWLKPNFPPGFFDNSYTLAERLLD